MGEWTLLGEALDYAVLGRTNGQVYIMPRSLLPKGLYGSKILLVMRRTINLPKPSAEARPEDSARLWTWWQELIARMSDEDAEGEVPLPPPGPPLWESDIYKIEDHEFMFSGKLKIVVRATYAEDHDLWLLRGIHASVKKEEEPLSEKEQRKNARPEIRRAGGIYRT